MANLNVAIESLRRRCGLADDSSDAELLALRDEMLPLVEASLDSTWLETDRPEVRALLEFGASEIVAGEFLSQRWREDCWIAEVRFGEFSWRQAPHAIDPSGLLARGWARLQPFLAADSGVSLRRGVLVGPSQEAS